VKYNRVLLKQNNYYNRKIKRYETLQEYLDNYEAIVDSSVINIDYNDGVNTSIVVNLPNSTNNELGYNYVLMIDIETDEIAHRWFIIDEKQTRQGQWQCKIRRDLIADFWDSFMESTTYVEKGRLTEDIISINNMNRLAFNQEHFTANKIKKSETQLKDIIGCKWIVGYANKGAWKPAEGQTKVTVEAIKNLAFQPSAVITNKSDLALDRNEFLCYATDITAQFEYKVTDINYPDATPLHKRRLNLSNEDSYFTELRSEPKGKIITPVVRNTYPTLLNYGYSTLLDYAKNNLNVSKRISQELWLNLLDLNGKIVRVTSEDKYYKVVVDRISGSSNRYDVNPSTDPTIYNVLKNYALQNDFVILEDTIENFRVDVYWSEGIKATLTEVSQGDYKVEIESSRNRTLGEAFDAFAIPYIEGEPIYIHLEDKFLGKVSDTSGALAIAQELTDVSTEALDLQLLPYCPLPDSMLSYYQADGDSKPYPIITVKRADVPYAAAQITNINQDKVYNVIFWLDSTQFSRIIPYTDTNNYSNLEEIKCRNQLDTWRISSGDYSSSFEFNMARNGGVQYFEVDCAYKPYKPYIHVAPNFGLLYGQDYNDTRGLVCSNTNYSLPRLTDAWESYERENLNYMNSFNRQIQNMDIIRDKQRAGEIVGAVAGTLTGVTSGAAMGSMVAPGIGGVVGGIAGGIASAAGGVTDIVMNEGIYKENKQYAIDKFNMSLENIQALPNTLAAAGALNPNNKVFPVLEYYSCSDIEKEAFLNKLKWNGMTIGVIGRPQDYIDTAKNCYFKGQVVDITIDGAAHEASELATEVAKGIILEGDN
jgi:hypothetical protein